MKKTEAFSFFYGKGLRRSGGWHEYERGKQLIQSDPDKAQQYDVWLKLLIEFVGV